MTTREKEILERHVDEAYIKYAEYAYTFGDNDNLTETAHYAWSQLYKLKQELLSLE